MKDRVVQMLSKLVLEPIWESDFLNCSNGFRPQRRTMDCLALLDSSRTNRAKYYWVIEGAIKGACDHLPRKTLVKLLAQRVADPRLLTLIARLLQAGVMDGLHFQGSEQGPPHGAICSPRLRKVYLPQFDLYWWQRSGSLDRKAKERRSAAHLGNCARIRYADEGLLLTKGSKAEAYRLREECPRLLADERHLEVALEKTQVTQVKDGVDFLGCHLRRSVSKGDRPKLLITPSRPAQARLKAKVKELTARRRYPDKPLLKFSALNTVLRGWMTYYRHCNAKKTAKDRDYWVNDRLFRWLQKRHRLPARRLLTLYQQRQAERRDNWGIGNGQEWGFL